MKSIIQAVAVAALLTTSFSTFAQAKTTAEVRKELVQLENVGYNPSQAASAHYPEDIQVAEARLATQNGVTRVESDSVGGVRSGSSDQSAPVAANVDKSLFSHR